MKVSSEIILNPDGSIYHLNLKPGEVAPTIITVGDPERVGLLAKRLDKVELERQNREFRTVTGKIGGKRLSIISTGIGTDNVDVVLNELHFVTNYDLIARAPVSDPQPLKIIRLGTSGSIQADLDLDQILISECALGFDNLLHFYDWENDESVERIEFLPTNLRPYVVRGSQKLLDLFDPVADVTGLTATLPGFYAPQGRVGAVNPRIQDFTAKLGQVTVNGQRVTNIEMETSGIYGLSALLQHEAVSVNALLANRATGEFSQNPEAVVQRMIDQTLELICSSPEFG